MTKKGEKNEMVSEKEMEEWDVVRAGAPAPLEPNALGLGSLSSVLYPKLPGLIPEIILPMSESGGEMETRDVPWLSETSPGPPRGPLDERGVPVGLREQAGKGLGRTGPVPAVAAAR